MIQEYFHFYENLTCELSLIDIVGILNGLRLLTFKFMLTCFVD